MLNGLVWRSANGTLFQAFFWLRRTVLRSFVLPAAAGVASSSKVQHERDGQDNLCDI
jgi:hypothetical protein